jgi:hypothetical protein
LNAGDSVLPPAIGGRPGGLPRVDNAHDQCCAEVTSITPEIAACD